MARLEEKLERFEKAVMSQATKQSQDILKTMEDLKNQEIALTENTALSSAYEMIQGEVSEITSGSAREISHKRLQQRHDYLLRRAAYEKSVFETVKNRLIAFTATDAYAQYLASAAKKLAADYSGGPVTLTLRNADRGFEPLVREGFGSPCTVAFSDDLAIGGLMLLD
ncbi:MAG: hypothetical protein ACERKO_07895, partial [Acetanaerobacterium sp.]